MQEPSAVFGTPLLPALGQSSAALSDWYLEVGVVSRKGYSTVTKQAGCVTDLE